MTKSNWALRPPFCACQLVLLGATIVALLAGHSPGVAMAAFPGMRPGVMPPFGGHPGGGFAPRPAAPVYRSAPKKPTHEKYVPPKRPPQKAVPQEHKRQQHAPRKQAPEQMQNHRTAPAKTPSTTPAPNQRRQRERNEIKPEHIPRPQPPPSADPDPSFHGPHDLILKRLDKQRFVPHPKWWGGPDKQSLPYQHGPHSKSNVLAAERHRPHNDWHNSPWDRDYWWYNHHFHDHYAYWDHYALWLGPDWWYWDDYDYDEAQREAAIAAIESQMAYAEEVLDETVSSEQQAQEKLDEYQKRISEARTAIESASAEHAADNKAMRDIEAQVISAQGPDSELSKAQAKVDELRQSLDKEAHRVLSLPPHAGKPTSADYVRELAILSPDQKEHLAGDTQFRAVEEEVKAATRQVLSVRRALFEANPDWVAARDAALTAQRENDQADRELGKYTGPAQLAPKQQLHTAEAIANQARQVIAAGKAALRILSAVPAGRLVVAPAVY